MASGSARKKLTLKPRCSADEKLSPLMEDLAEERLEEGL
jgi:hypothetical protein